MDLAAAIALAGQSGGSEVAYGNVVAYSAGHIQVAVGDPGAAPLTAFYLASYLPAVGDNVVLLGSRGSWVVLGNFGDTPGQMKVRDGSGNTVVEVGLLDDGTYGLAAAQGGQLVDLSQLAYGLTAATVATSENTTSTSFVDLTTPGPSVTVNIGSSGRALAFVSALMSILPGTSPTMGVAVSGATTIAPNAARSLSGGLTSPASGSLQASRMLVFTGLAAGSTTFKAQYASTAGGTSVWTNREIAVLPY